VGQLAQQVLFQWDIGEEDFVAAIREMVSDGSLILKAPSYDVETGLDYLFTPTLSGWVWSAVLLSSAAVLSIFMIPDLFPLNVVGWILGSAFMLYLPGYALMQFLFPKGVEMDSLERFALSVGLSLAVVPLIGLVLNYLPWGIRLTPITVSLSVFTFLFTIAAATRQYMGLRGHAS